MVQTETIGIESLTGPVISRLIAIVAGNQHVPIVKAIQPLSLSFSLSFHIQGIDQPALAGFNGPSVPGKLTALSRRLNDLRVLKTGVLEWKAKLVKH